MRNISLILFLLLGIYTSAQTNCQNAAPFCASGVSGVNFPATTGIPSAQTGPNYGCLGSTPNPAWYYLQISNSGNLDILIQGTITSPAGPGQDVDFICWGPFTSLAGACNSLTANNTIDCSYSGSFTETLNIPNGVAGEYYMVLITNFANVQQNIVFSQFAGTGSTNCSLLSSNSKICAGSNATIVATNSGNLANPTYSLSNGLTNSTGSFVVTPSVTTNYTAYVTGTNTVSSALVTQTALSTVTVEAQPSIAPTVTNTTCYVDTNIINLNLTFFPTSPTPGYTVTWSTIPPGITQGNQTSTYGQIPAGPYSATVTTAGGCTATANFSVSPQPDPAVINFQPFNTNHTVTCFQPSITVTAMLTVNNYTWNNNVIAPISGTNAVVFTNTMTGTWIVTAQHSISQCVSTKTITVNVDQVAPTATIAPTFQNITCAVGSIQTVTIVATPSINILNEVYSPQQGTVSASSYTSIYQPGGVGIYTTASINSNNGCTTFHTFTVTSNQSFPSYTLSSPQSYTLGCGTKSVATVNIDNPQGGGGGATTYTILPPGSSSPAGLLSSITQYTMNNPGTYTVVVRDNVSFCETSVPISILSNTLPPHIDVDTIAGNYILSCFDPDVVLYGKSLTPGATFQWNFPFLPGTKQGDSLTVNSLTATPNNSVVGVFTLQVTNSSSTCKSFSLINVYQDLYKPTALVAGLKKITCSTQTITLNNQSTSNVPTGTIFPTGKPVTGWKWEGPSPQEPLMISSSYVAGVPGDYTLTVRDQNNGCTSTTVFPVADGRVFPELTVTNSTLSCGQRQTTVAVKATGLPDNQAIYFWKAASASTSTTGLNGKSTYTVTETGSYYITVTDINNGCTKTSSATVVSDSLFANFDISPVSGYAPLDVTFYNNSASTTGSQSITAIWNFGNGRDTTTDVNNLSPTTTYALPGTYTIVLYVNKGKCIDSSMRTVQVEIPSELTIPNIFTPNGDGVNDVYFLKTSSLGDINAVIYDRWGHVVYELTSPNGNIAWDGKNQYGKDCAEGVYFYMIKSSGKDGKEYDKKGSITLVR